MSSRRVAQKVLKLESRLASIQSGTILPKNIASLRIRFQGLQGESGARHWIKEMLPGLIHSNPSIPVTIDRRSKKLTKAESVESKVEPWKSIPGCFISFHDDTEEAFFPLSSARSEKLMKRFNDTMASGALLRALPRAKDADKAVVALVEPEVSVEGIEETKETELSTTAVVGTEVEATVEKI